MQIISIIDEALATDIGYMPTREALIPWYEPDCDYNVNRTATFHKADVRIAKY
jgi:hypothetical protein